MRGYIPRDMIPVPVETPLTDERRAKRAKAMGERAGRTPSSQISPQSQRKASNHNRMIAELNRSAARVARGEEITP